MTPEEALIAIADAVDGGRDDVSRIIAIRTILGHYKPRASAGEALKLARMHAARIPSETSKVGEAAKAAITALVEAMEDLTTQNSSAYRLEATACPRCGTPSGVIASGMCDECVEAARRSVVK